MRNHLHHVSCRLKVKTPRAKENWFIVEEIKHLLSSLSGIDFYGVNTELFSTTPSK